ncbi:thiolase family protein [Candidatus Parcubacteria bacterium]|nr:MAG: thiolase family protein [Candidatus Parcubacteria bacterium]
MKNNKDSKDVVVVAGARTGTGAFGGTLRTFLGIDMATEVIKESLVRAKLIGKENVVDDVIFGQMYFRNKEEANIGRLAGLRAGLPVEVPGMTLQRACASGLQAIISGAQEIISGQSKVVIAGGAESMSNAPYELYSLRWGVKVRNEELFDSMYTPILSCPPTGTGMGITAENLCEKFGISREQCDEFAVTSHQRAASATEGGKFKEEMLALKIKDKKGNIGLFDVDESVRKDNTIEKMGKLRPAFKEGGKITPGNSCPLNDGASAVVLMNRETAERFGLTPIAKIVAYAVVGVEPDIMGYGPVPATRKALEKAGLKISDCALFEVNEAFAPVALVYLKELGIPGDMLNVNGGAIALGHAIGSSGVRISITLMHEMAKTGVRYGVSAICQGTGMGTAMIFENERI